MDKSQPVVADHAATLSYARPTTRWDARVSVLAVASVALCTFGTPMVMACGIVMGWHVPRVWWIGGVAGISLVPVLALLQIVNSRRRRAGVPLVLVALGIQLIWCVIVAVLVIVNVAFAGFGGLGVGG